MSTDDEKVYGNIDELITKMQLDELADAPLISPVNYAKVRARLTPQSVYYRIRTKQLKTYTCNCGRKCINIKEADALFFPSPDDDTDENEDE